MDLTTKISIMKRELAGIVRTLNESDDVDAALMAQQSMATLDGLQDQLDASGCHEFDFNVEYAMVPCTSFLTPATVSGELCGNCGWHITLHSEQKCLFE